MEGILNNFEEAIAMLLFAIGLSTLLFHKNLIKKIIGLNIMDTGLYLFLTCMGYIEGRHAPIIENTTTPIDPSTYINPVPSALVLTGIVVSVSVTAIMLALSTRLYKTYHTLDLDKIYVAARKRDEEEEQRK